jgi:hypothetical protein
LFSAVLAWWTESRRHQLTRRQLDEALSRNTWSGVEQRVPEGKFRLLVGKLLERNGSLIARMRIESSGRRRVQLIGAVTSATAPDPQHPDVFWSELLLCYVQLNDGRAWCHVELRNPGGMAATTTTYDQAAGLQLQAAPGVYEGKIVVAMLGGEPLYLNVQ